MKKFAFVSVAAALAAMLASGAAVAADLLPQQIPGQKIDSGLGELPHYRHWVDKTGKTPLPTRVVGEKLDSGLGDIQPRSPSRTSIELAQRT